MKIHAVLTSSLSDSKWVKNSARGHNYSDSKFSSASVHSLLLLSLSAVRLVKSKPKTHADLRRLAQPWTNCLKVNLAPHPARRFSNVKMIYKKEQKFCFFHRKHSGQCVLSILLFFKEKKVFFKLLSELLEMSVRHFEIIDLLGIKREKQVVNSSVFIMQTMNTVFQIFYYFVCLIPEMYTL